MTISAAKFQIISEAVADLERSAGLLAKTGSTMSWSDRLERVEAEVLGQAWEGDLIDRIEQLQNHFEVLKHPIAALAKSAGIPVGITREPAHHGYKGFGGALAGLYELRCG
jgi:hypothetical protein